ncbi:GNAT family N-acetyltransferase [Actinomadura mexicana]|uniref:Acetyltransferase (GNAT) family protein n=1 Tax=Actinomadura mexicana TaxID=134959 RepID=A0A238XKB9_9ACTN|nr:GNAT family N-acetyltransferase [Actinomadura mexicana]SNR59445.1 Acetyltransferase (GNAT) family protein [Actinomadura mexicana]
MNDVTVRPLSAADKDEACRLIGLAFAGHQSTLAIVRGDRGKATRIMRQSAHIIIDPGSRFRHVLVAEREGRLAGVIHAVEWPHCQLTAGQKLRTAPALIRAMGSALPRAMAVTKARAEHEPRKDHWHLGPTAVHPDHQGHGIGTALFGSILELADKQGSAAFAQPDADHTVSLCEKFDFKLIAEQEIQGLATRSMWREAR